MSHLDVTAMRLESAPFRLRQYIQQNLEKWIDETIVDQIKLRAAINNLPLEYRESIRIEKKGDFKYDVVLDYNRGSVPLGIFFEKGTRGHIIKAKFADALRWISKTTGKPIFAKQVRHPGTHGYHIMEESARIGIPILAQKIVQETTKFLQESKIQ